MKIPPVKGTRDFYPEEQAVHNWIVDGWKRASIRNGFEEYDGPIFEYLQMYQIKSGDEIVEQLFSFKDRGDRDLAIRPEITPTLARMVNQRINALPKPIKWFSVPRLCRAERPQKGRLREFFQWNIDIIGEDSTYADADVIATTVDYLQEVGLTPDDIRVKISSRKLLSAVLKKIGVPEEKLNPLYALLDKKAKLPQDTFSAMLKEQVGDNLANQIISFTEIKDDISGIGKLVRFETGDEVDNSRNELLNCILRLRLMHSDNYEVLKYCDIDLSVVRGLAYYTGIIFEVHDAKSDLRAICGGGRYDNLLHDFGGPKISATGMGMGDCVLEILLREKGLLKLPPKQPVYFVVSVPLEDGSVFHETAVPLVIKMRKLGVNAMYSYKENISLTKQLKLASEKKADYCVIIGDEYRSGNIKLKNMASGEQKTISLKDFLENPAKFKF
jgi:histidyl-tRNA synthetase